MSGYEELAALAAEAYRGAEGGPRDECDRCGAPTRNEICRKCELVDAVGGELPSDD
jgi:hypothetical protein